MYLKIDKKKKLEIIELIGFWNRFKSLKFVLTPLDYGVRFNKKKIISTYFLCQKVDIITTDKENNIIMMYEKIRSEKFIWAKKKVYYVYFLPLDTIKNYKIGDKLKLIENKKKND